MDDVQKVWEEFWVPTFDGVEPTAEEIKKELYDFYKLIGNVSKVYCHVTGGLVSKPLTDPDVVISLFEDYTNDLVEGEIKDRVALNG